MSSKSEILRRFAPQNDRFRDALRQDIIRATRRIDLNPKFSIGKLKGAAAKRGECALFVEAA
jgi:hypothetical protein